MSEARSDSPTKCGICGGEAYTPSRFEGEDTGGIFNVCGELGCEAECTGTGGRDEADRYYWTGAAQVAQGRDAMAAMELDAEMAEFNRY
jgi:hypothetical protein